MNMDGGTPGAQAVVLLHGARSSPQTWVAHGMAELNRFRWYLPDLNDLFAKGSVIDVLDAYLAEQRIKSAIFIGHSFGAHVAVQYAKRRPVRCSGLVLLNAPGLFDMLGPFGYWFALIARLRLAQSDSSYDRFMARAIRIGWLCARFDEPLTTAIRFVFQPVVVIQSDGDFVSVRYAKAFARLFYTNSLRVIRGNHSAVSTRTKALADAVSDLVGGGGAWVNPCAVRRSPKVRWTSWNPLVADEESEAMLAEVDALVRGARPPVRSFLRARAGRRWNGGAGCGCKHEGDVPDCDFV